MLSANANLSEFVNQVANHPYDDIIILADREATAAQRQSLRQGSSHDSNGMMETYALLLKDVLTYMRHGVATRALRNLDRRVLDQLPQR